MTIINSYYVQRFPEGHEKEGQIKCLYGGPQDFLGDDPEIISEESEAYKEFMAEFKKPELLAGKRAALKEKFAQLVASQPVATRVVLVPIQSTISQLLDLGDFEAAIYALENAPIPENLTSQRLVMVNGLKQLSAAFSD